MVRASQDLKYLMILELYVSTQQTARYRLSSTNDISFQSEISSTGFRSAFYAETVSVSSWEHVIK